MPTQAQHTPGPWKYQRTHPQSGDAWFVLTDARGYGPIMEVGGHDVNGQVAEAKYMITEPDIIEANAEFICRACNSHDGLVAALKDMLSIADSTHGAQARTEKARAILKAATGEK